MKRTGYAALAAVVLMLSGVTARADEGMWLLPLLQKMNSNVMRSLGCGLSAKDIYDINGTSLKDAVVQFGSGCTAEIISPEGLLVTNHHCGYSSIQQLSSTEHNYLENGYWAMDRSGEIPVPGLKVTFLESMTDVTKVVSKASDPVAEKERLVEDAQRENPHCMAVVTDFYSGNVSYLIVYKEYRDVRFVGAPPVSCGKFGGETDNWMWPRHTCDFSMFRIYAGPENEPAEYSAENVPLRSKNSLKISLKGVKDGDFAMIMGYPGRTQRLQTAEQMKQMLELNDVRIDARTVRQDVMWKAMRADERVSLQYASKYASSSNGWKKWIGMRQSFEKLDIIGRQEAEEQAFSSWVAEKSKRREAYGGALDDIAEVMHETTEARKAYTLLLETLYKIELISFGTKADAAAYKDYDLALDRQEADALAAHYLANVKEADRLEIPDLDELFASSVFTSFSRLSQARKDSVSLVEDPAIVFHNRIVRKLNSLMQVVRDNNDKLASASRAYNAGLLEWKKGEPSYPDANFTMRLTYGTVKSYEPRDGVIYKHYTTLKGVIEKWNPDDYEFRVPDRLRAIYESKDYGDYANAAGELPACFLTNCDITGGNSGSPVLNSRGELIGLAFDGNWESMSSDVMFEPEYQRCICVDIRYVLLMMDKFGGAGYLREEMEIVK